MDKRKNQSQVERQPDGRKEKTKKKKKDCLENIKNQFESFSVFYNHASPTKTKQNKTRHAKQSNKTKAGIFERKKARKKVKERKPGKK